MIIFLLCVIAVLLCIIAAQYISRKHRRHSVQYITDKLSSMIDKASPEQVLLVTDADELKSLLNEINRLVDLTRQYEMDFTRTKLSMRRMLTNISHDLKTPLTVVLGYIEMVVNQPKMDAEEQKQLLLKVHVKTMEIVDMINRFFDLAKLESGDKELALTRVPMNELCRNNILTYYDLIQSSGMEAVIEIPDAPVYAWGNEEALNRALHNLLSNAIRYGGDGPSLGITLRSDEEHVYIDVWDQGKGISERDQHLIFERMYTLEDSRNKSFQGSGLGLAITKRLVELMEGQIQVASSPYEKTVFTMTFRRLP